MVTDFHHQSHITTLKGLWTWRENHDWVLISLFVHVGYSLWTEDGGMRKEFAKSPRNNQRPLIDRMYIRYQNFLKKPQWLLNTHNLEMFPGSKQSVSVSWPPEKNAI